MGVEPVRIEIPFGTIFKPVNNSSQIAVVPIDVLVTLQPNEEVIIEIPVYCNNKDLGMPNKNDYQLTNLKLSKELLVAMNDIPVSKRQSWLWKQGSYELR